MGKKKGHKGHKHGHGHGHGHEHHSKLHGPVSLGLDSDEEKILAEMREKYKEHYNKREVPDEMLVKMLRARKWDVKKALNNLKNYYTWYDDMGETFISMERVRHVIEQDIIMFPGTRDKDGYYIVYMKPAKYFPGELSTAELMRAVVYTLERAIEVPHVQVHGFTFIADMQNWGWSNFEVGYAQAFMNTMESRFPARLRKFVLVDPPSWFNLVWALIRPMFSAKFASKWHFLTRETVEGVVAKEELTADLGGTAKFTTAAYVQERLVKEAALGIKHDPQARVSNDSAMFAARAT